MRKRGTYILKALNHQFDISLETFTELSIEIGDAKPIKKTLKIFE